MKIEYKVLLLVSLFIILTYLSMIFLRFMIVEFVSESIYIQLIPYTLLGINGGVWLIVVIERSIK